MKFWVVIYLEWCHLWNIIPFQKLSSIAIPSWMLRMIAQWHNMVKTLFYSRKVWHRRWNYITRLHRSPCTNAQYDHNLWDYKLNWIPCPCLPFSIVVHLINYAQNWAIHQHMHIIRFLPPWEMLSFLKRTWKMLSCVEPPRQETENQRKMASGPLRPITA